MNLESQMLYLKTESTQNDIQIIIASESETLELVLNKYNHSNNFKDYTS
jgi:hypothetical protein